MYRFPTYWTVAISKHTATVMITPIVTRFRRKVSAACSSGHRSLFSTFIFAISLATAASAQIPADSAQDRIERAFATNDVAALRTVRAEIERALSIRRDPWLEHYYGFALFRESLMVDEETVGVDAYAALLRTAEAALRSSAERLEVPETYAVLARILGRMLSLEPERGAQLGPQQADLRARAERIDQNNPRIWLLRGVSAIYTPPQYGGGLDRAESWVQKAVELFEHDSPQAPAPRWGRAEAQHWLVEIRSRKATQRK